MQVDFGGPGRGPWLDEPGRIEALGAESRFTGVRLLAVAGNHLNDLGLTTAGTRVHLILTRLLDAARALGVPLVFVPSFKRSAIDSPDAFDRTAEVLRWAASEAEARGLLLASENVLPGERARELAERVASPAFRLVLDTFNPVAAGLAAGPFVDAVGDLLADQVHIKDGPPDVGATPLLGTGTGQLDDTLGALHRNGVPVAALVLENDYRDGDRTRLRADLEWVRRRARRMSWAPREVG